MRSVPSEITSRYNSDTANGLDKLKPRSSVNFLLIAILLIALLLRVAVATHFPTFDWADEVFNTLEPAHHLAYGYGVVAWEWRLGVRSWVFPAFLAGVMRLTDWMGPGSFGYLSAIRFILSLLSLTTVWFGYVWGRRASGEAAAVIAAVTCAIWYELVYFAPKALNDVVAGHLLLPGLYLGMYGEVLPEKKRLFLAGLFLGAAVAMRMQLAPTVAFAAIYFCHKRWASRGPFLISGLLVPVVIFGLVDAATWSYPFQSYFRYIKVVVLEGEGHGLIFGTSAWYWYLWMLAVHFFPLFLFALVGIRRSHFLGWVAFIILASHSLFAYKEYRFIYPVMPILITLAALGFVEFAEDFKAWANPNLSPKMIEVAGLIFCICASGFVAWKSPRRNSKATIAMDQLSMDSSVCGVGLYEVPWIRTGGYSHLHENVPIILVQQESELEPQIPGFNALLTHGTFTDPKARFKSEGCWNEFCLYRRPGPCIASSQYNEVNKVLRETGH